MICKVHLWKFEMGKQETEWGCVLQFWRVESEGQATGSYVAQYTVNIIDCFFPC